MNQEELELLSKFYKKLKSEIQKFKRKSFKNQSPLLIFLSTQQKNVRMILKKSGIPKYKIQEINNFERLYDNNLIKEGDQPGEFIITPKGIWEYENVNKLVDIGSFLEYFDKKYFQFLKKKEEPFDYKEKVVIFTMLAIRSYTKDEWIDLNQDKEFLNNWKKVFNESLGKLYELEIIQQTEKENFWKKKTKHDDITDPVYYLLRHTNDLPRKSNDLYKFSGNKQYYLNLSYKKEIFKNQIEFLLKKIFNEKLHEIYIKQDIIDFFHKISFEYSLYVFSSENKFANPHWDSELREIINYI